MTDVFDKKKRSEIMSRIRSKDTKPEILVRKFLHSKGFRFRLHPKSLPGKPDLVLPKYKVAVFVHGCFWHGHENAKCNAATIPKTNTQFWINKISYNKSRDSKNIGELKELGWLPIIIWTCELKGKSIEMYLKGLVQSITQNKI